MVGDRGDDESAVVFEPNEAPIEKMIDTGRQAADREAFLIGQIPPWFAMTSDEMNRITAAPLAGNHKTLARLNKRARGRAAYN